MNRYTFKRLLLKEGWLRNVSVEVDETGIIRSINPNQEIANDLIAIPAFYNAHSHAFQFAMAGQGELHNLNASGDDFWSWRKQMYDLAGSIEPEDLYEIGKNLYGEMKKHGYCQVAEFHYVHHQKNGEEYDDLSTMGEALLAAAQDVGLAITLVPIFYQLGGFGKPATEGQKRFISKSFEDYQRMLEHTLNKAQKYDLASVGIGMHSLRGVSPEDVIRSTNELDQDLPFHIHISEQLKEVNDCIDFHGVRPVEWLLENTEVTDRFHLVHATHLNEKEVVGIAKSGANVVLCPSTEGNLGDGLFPLKQFQDLDGRWSIGTDSHVGLNPCEEIRIIDYGQRLTTHRRDTFGGYDYEDSGAYAIRQAFVNGRKAMGLEDENYFEIGGFFNACIFNANAKQLKNCPDEKLASAIIYSTDRADIDKTYVRGK